MDKIPVERVSLGLALSALFIGLLGLLGWILNVNSLTNILPSMVTMKMNTAIAIVTLSVGCIFWTHKSLRHLAPLSSLLVLTLALGTILQYTLGWNLVIDRLHIHDDDSAFPSPGRMSGIAAITLFVLSISILIRHFFPRKTSCWQAPSLVILLLPMLALAGLLFNPRAHPDIFPYQTIALPTSLSLILLCLSVVSSSRSGLMANVLSPRLGGRVARRFLPILLLALLGLGLSTELGSSFQIFDESFDVPYLLTFGSAFTAWLIWHESRTLNDLDAKLEVEQLNGRDLIEHLQLLINHSPGAAALFDREMKYIWANARWMQDLLPNLAVVTGKSVYETFPKLDDKWRAIHGRCLAGAIERGTEERYVDENGTARWYRWEIRPWTSAHGGIGGLVIFSENVTEQKTEEIRRAEEETRYRQQLETEVNKRTQELQLSQQKYQRLVEDGFDPVLVVDDHEKIVYCNRQLEQLFGYDPGELLGQNVKTLVPFRFRGRHEAFVGRYLRNPTRRPMGRRLELFGLKKNGTELPVEISVSPIATPEGLLVTAIVRDITEKTHYENKQKFLTELSRSLTETLDKTAIIQNMVDLTTRNIAETCIIREPNGHILASNDKPGFKAGTKIELPLTILGKTAGSIALASDSAYRNLPTDLEFLRNVVSRFEAALTNAELYQQARQATKEREAILGIVSHDLKNPVSVIQMSAELLTHSTLTEAEVHKLGDRLNSSSSQMLRLLDDLLNFAKIESKTLHVSPSAISVPAIFDEAVASLKDKFVARRVDLSVDVANSLPHVMADKIRIVQVLWNLLGNALKFTPIGGRVTLSAKALGDTVLFSVSDTGPGIPPADRTKIFQSFWQAKITAEMGTGLGLAIAKGIIDAHGGKIWVESEPGQGSTFNFTLYNSTAQTQQSNEPHFNLNGLTVLCVDDSEDNLDLIKLTLEKRGAHVLIARSVTEALSELAKSQPDVIVTDIEMPTHSGFDLLRSVRSELSLSEIPIIAFTANSQDQTELRLLRSGFNAVIPKPFSTEKLASAVRSAVQVAKVRP